MKSMSVIALILLASLRCMGQNTGYVLFKEQPQVVFSKEEPEKIIQHEIVRFVNLINKTNPPVNNKYNVYVVNLFECDSTGSAFCFTLGYFMDLTTYKFIQPSHIYFLNEEVILVRMKEGCLKLFKGLPLQKIGLNEEMVVKNKLIQEGSLTGEFEGFVLCRMGDRIDKKFYERSSEIPLDKSIYSYFPGGVIMEKIK